MLESLSPDLKGFTFKNHLKLSTRFFIPKESNRFSPHTKVTHQSSTDWKTKIRLAKGVDISTTAVICQRWSSAWDWETPPLPTKWGNISLTCALLMDASMGFSNSDVGPCFFVAHFQNCTMSMRLAPRFLWTCAQQFVGLLYLKTIPIKNTKIGTFMQDDQGKVLKFQNPN